ncbi:hypothetical protein T492DRAFT_1000936 [Pavlovales sp. CCMP2436]|nr:hypothetical protein T492DRAFT_1000936 [Pavlovales sp. CCMP2436]
MAVGVDAWGVCSGVLFVFSGLFAFLAVPLVGLSVAQGVWGGAAVFVSFAWGALGQAPLRAPLASLPLSLLALTLLFLGVAGIAGNGAIARRLFALHTLSRSLLADAVIPAGHGLEGDEGGGDGGSGGTTAAAEDANPANHGLYAVDEGGDVGEPPAGARPRRVAAGIASALLVGVFGGSTLVPSKFVAPEFSGLAVLPSFGVGAAAAGLLVCATHVASCACRSKPAGWGGLAAVPAGLASGLVWSLGNICAIYAMGPGQLNYGIAYPIVQCALLVSGLLGICIFHEISDSRAIAVFFSAAAVLVAGAALLGYAGPGGVGLQHGGRI